MTFDPDKARRYKPIEYDEMPCDMVTVSDYDQLLQLYREEQVKSANAAFLEQTDAAITESQAKTIKRLMGEKNG